MELEGSLPHSQAPETCPYPQPHQFSLSPEPHLLRINFNIILPPTPNLLKALFPSSLPTKTLHETLVSPIHATCPAHRIILYFICSIILGEECKPWSSSARQHTVYKWSSSARQHTVYKWSSSARQHTTLVILSFFLSLKCSLFHNSNLFGSCIIHILYTECAKIKKIIPAPKG